MSMLVSGLLVLATGCDADGEAAGLADRVLPLDQIAAFLALQSVAG